eukprot:827727-Amorphochlora_amoeboformis.AAC.1
MMALSQEQKSKVWRDGGKEMRLSLSTDPSLLGERRRDGEATLRERWRDRETHREPQRGTQRETLTYTGRDTNIYTYLCLCALLRNLKNERKIDLMPHNSTLIRFPPEAFPS